MSLSLGASARETCSVGLRINIWLWVDDVASNILSFNPNHARVVCQENTRRWPKVFFVILNRLNCLERHTWWIGLWISIYCVQWQRQIHRGVHTIKHKTFVLYLYNVGQTSKTLGRRCTNVIQMLCVFWDVAWCGWWLVLNWAHLAFQTMPLILHIFHKPH